GGCRRSTRPTRLLHWTFPAAFYTLGAREGSCFDCSGDWAAKRSASEDRTCGYAAESASLPYRSTRARTSARGCCVPSNGICSPVWARDGCVRDEDLHGDLRAGRGG